MKKLTKEEFIKRATEIHGAKYDYSKVEYKKSHEKVCIICPEHGEFWQSPSNHMMGKKCPKCSKVYMDNAYFIEKARQMHGDKYDYSKVNYVNSDTKVCIICPEHGEFWQLPYSHVTGCGCPYCGGTQKSSTFEFIEKARQTHGDKYDYSKVEYVNNNTKICIVCPKHGEFWQTPQMHLQKNGCPICSKEQRRQKRVLPLGDYIDRANEVHKNTYKYDLVEYENLKDKVAIICPKHGVFYQEAWSHLIGQGCPACGNSISKNENAILEYCQKLIGKEHVERRNHTVIPPKEIDIYIPKLKIGIEYNGLLWHSEKYNQDASYHLKKLNACRDKGIKLIQIFEDEYIYNKDIVLCKIRHLLNKDDNLPKIMGRKCNVLEIGYDESKKFLDSNHIQGGVSSTIYLGAYYDKTLIGVMSFKRRSKTSDKWELNRFATDNGYRCQGVGGKLFSYFVNKYNPVEIKSFADRRWTINENDNLYIKLGFAFDGYVLPDYRYYSPNDGYVRQHKFNFRKQNLHKKYGFPLTMTESEMMEKLKYYKIWDCGLIRYVWKR